MTHNDWSKENADATSGQVRTVNSQFAPRVNPGDRSAALCPGGACKAAQSPISWLRAPKSSEPTRTADPSSTIWGATEVRSRVLRSCSGPMLGRRFRHLGLPYRPHRWRDNPP